MQLMQPWHFLLSTSKYPFAEGIDSLASAINKKSGSIVLSQAPIIRPVEASKKSLRDTFFVSLLFFFGSHILILLSDNEFR